MSALAKRSYHERLASLRRNAQAKQNIVEAPAMSTLAGMAIGFAEKKGFLPVAVFGLPSKGVLFAAGVGVALNTRGGMQRAALEVARAAGCIYGYDAIMSGNWVAGEDDDET